VLQLTLNNVAVMRILLGLVAPFTPWNPKHWSTGAYLINRKGCQGIVKKYANPHHCSETSSSRATEVAAPISLPPGSTPPAVAVKYVLPAGERLVADIIMYRGSGCYTYTRPLFEHEIASSTIHQTNVDTTHKPAAELAARFYQRLQEPWEGATGDARAALTAVQGGLVVAACSSSETSSGRSNAATTRQQLAWWCPNVAVELAEARAAGLTFGDAHYYCHARALAIKRQHFVGQHWRVRALKIMHWFGFLFF
jgi:hypothetical protein